MSDAQLQALLSAIRTILIAVGGVLATKGYTSADNVNQIVGAIMVILPALWGVWDKYRSEAATKVRETAAVQAGVALAPNPVISPSAITPIHAQEIIAANAT